MDRLLNQKRQPSTLKAFKTKNTNSIYRERHGQVLKVEDEAGGRGIAPTQKTIEVLRKMDISAGVYVNMRTK